jgi:hypothetical protein
MDPKELRGLYEAYSEVYAPQEEIDEAQKPFPFKKVEKQMEKARKGSVYAKKENPGPVPNTTDAEKKATTRFSKMFHAQQKAKRAKQEADKARRSPTFYKDTHPASAPKMAKAQREEFEIDEAVKGESSERRKDLAAERKAGHRPLSKKEGDANAAHMARKVRFADKVTKAKGHMPGYTYGEEVEIFDVVLEFLQVEGYAETLEEAEWLMANMIDEEAINIIPDKEDFEKWYAANVR